MNIFEIIFGLICSANGFIILPIIYPVPEETYSNEDDGKFFPFSGDILPKESTPELTPFSSDQSTNEESDMTTTSATETVLLIPLSETIFVPEYLIPSASFYAASNEYSNPPTDTQLPSNFELAELADTVQVDPIVEYVQNYPLANNLQQHDSITEEQMLLTQLHDMDFVNKTEIKPTTSINNFHVNQQQRQHRSQQHLLKSEYQQPFQNVNLSSYTSSTNINETNSSIDEKHILATETRSHARSKDKTVASLETMTTHAEENFGALFNDATWKFFKKAYTTIIKEFLDENGQPCVAEQLQFYSKTYFRYTCEGELFQVPTISTTSGSEVAQSNGEIDEASVFPFEDDMSAAQVDSLSLPADLHNFHSFYLKRKAT